jgi:hypothetical protein
MSVAQMKQHIRAIFLPCICSLIGCTGNGLPGSSNSAQDELDQNREVWESAGISNYSYRFQRSCECLPEVTRPFVVSVQNGVITEVRDFETGEVLDEDGLGELRVSTVEGLFDVIQEAINDRADSISIEYDSELGYPSSINIDHDEQISDEETILTAQDLTVD